ncbi:hypothetical protein Tsubulata_034851, partial [Turnera subulata]
MSSGMGTCRTLLALLMALTSTVSTAEVPSKSQELTTAIEEMVTANYFTFVMLINMSPFDPRLQGNVTFLMPNDRMLSKIRITQTSVSDFLLRHSIPSPLLFDYLQHIPSGSMIPTSDSRYMLSVNNNGRRDFSLNNVKIISPNLCTAGSSIRCHGIDGVLEAAQEPPLTTCPNSTSPAIVASPPETPSFPSSPPSFPSPPEASGGTPPVPAAAPTPEQSKPKKSGSSHPKSHGELIKFLAASLVVSM